MPVPAPTALRLGEVGPNGDTMLVPEATTVTPTANALVFLLINWGNNFGATTPTPVQPSWAAQAWTPVFVSGEAADGIARVGVWWTIATGSPGAAAVTINFTGFGFQGGAGGALFEYASGYDPTTPIRQFKTVTVASIAGNAALTDTLTSAPLSGSQLLELGHARGNSRQAPSDAASGWTKPTPLDEGFNQTSYVAHAPGTNGSTYGGDFGNTTPADDHPNGAVFVAMEIQEAAGSSQGKAARLLM